MYYCLYVSSDCGFSVMIQCFDQNLKCDVIHMTNIRSIYDLDKFLEGPLFLNSVRFKLDNDTLVAIDQSVIIMQSNNKDEFRNMCINYMCIERL